MAGEDKHWTDEHDGLILGFSFVYVHKQTFARPFCSTPIFFFHLLTRRFCLGVTKQWNNSSSVSEVSLCLTIFLYVFLSGLLLGHYVLFYGLLCAYTEAQTCNAEGNLPDIGLRTAEAVFLVIL